MTFDVDVQVIHVWTLRQDLIFAPQLITCNYQGKDVRPWLPDEAILWSAIVNSSNNLPKNF